MFVNEKMKFLNGKRICSDCCLQFNFMPMFSLEFDKIT